MPRDMLQFKFAQRVIQKRQPDERSKRQIFFAVEIGDTLSIMQMQRIFGQECRADCLSPSSHFPEPCSSQSTQEGTPNFQIQRSIITVRRP